MKSLTDWLHRRKNHPTLSERNADRRVPRSPVFLLLAGLALLSGCRIEDPMDAKGGGLIVNGFNHTDTSLVFSVEGQTGALVFPHSSGGGACCLGIYEKWRPGMTVTVSWSQGKDEAWHERVVPVPEYGDSIGFFNVHFLRDGEIKVFATLYYPHHKDYPFKGPEAGLWEPGKSPREIWNKAENGNLDDKVKGFSAWFVHNGGLSFSQKPGFEAFVRRQLQAAQAYGIEDWRSQDEFVNMAVFTNGDLVNYPMIRDWLAKRNRTQTFKEFSATVPKDIYDDFPAFDGAEPEPQEDAQ